MIATYFPPMGGIGTVRVTKYVKYLKKFNWIPTVLTVEEKNVDNYDETLMKDIDKDIEIIRLKLPTGKKIGINFYKSLKEEIDKIIKIKKYDAVFITGGPFEPLKIAPYIYKKFKIPYIIDLRDPWKLQKLNTNTKLNMIKSKVKRFLDGFSEKKVLKYAFAVCTVNDTMTMQYQKEYPSFKNKIFTISNGYDIDDYKSIIPKKISKFSIIYAGKFGVSAGFRDPSSIFKAIRILNEKEVNVNFVHIGNKEQNVIDLAKKECIEKNCIFLGRKSYKETLEYCKGANILLVIGGNEKCEQTGKIFDYIGCENQILVLANEDSEINVVCKKITNAYCIKKNDIDSIVDTIIKIYKNDVKENLKMPEEYSREYLTSQLVQILDKIRNKL